LKLKELSGSSSNPLASAIQFSES